MLPITSSCSADIPSPPTGIIFPGANMGGTSAAAPGASPPSSSFTPVLLVAFPAAPPFSSGDASSVAGSRSTMPGAVRPAGESIGSEPCTRLSSSWICARLTGGAPATFMLPQGENSPTSSSPGGAGTPIPMPPPRACAACRSTAS
eukprot:8628845-Pyramimonas_sp.AAC.1